MYVSQFPSIFFTSNVNVFNVFQVVATQFFNDLYIKSLKWFIFISASFEVTVGDTLVFSKLKLNAFPIAQDVSINAS